MLGALDDVVVTLAVGDEHPEPIESRRPRDAASEHDHHVPLARGDELLASFEEPAVVACGCRRRRDVADIRSRLRLGHRDRPHEPTLGEDRLVDAGRVEGQRTIDQRRRRIPPDAVLHLGREVGSGQHLADHHHDGEWEPGSAELDRHRRRCEPELRETAQVLRHRIVHPDLAVLADDADLVHLRGARRDLARHVAARDVEDLTPRRDRLIDVRVDTFDGTHDRRPRDDPVEDLDEVRIPAEEVGRAHSSKNGRRERSDSAGPNRSPCAAASRSRSATID